MKVAITGGRGFVGSLLVKNLAAQGVKCVVLDYYDGHLHGLLTQRYLMPVRYNQMDSAQKKVACLIRKIQKRLFRVAQHLSLFHKTGFDITSNPTDLVSAFNGCDAVVHLAAIPHPGVKGKTQADFIRINYEAAVSVYESAVKAGATRFVFASSGQVYDINQNREWTRFPIRESDADIYQKSEGLHVYAKLKWKFEQYLIKHSEEKKIKSFALRLELPGILAASEKNMYVQVSVENLVQAFYRSLVADVPYGGYVMNIADSELPPGMGNPAEVLRGKWPEVPCGLKDYQTPFCLETAKELIGFQPETGGSYFHPWTAF
jgi:dTDP-4-dehydrorhamnose reductase